MIFNKLFGLFSHDIGIDLGTANTLVYVSGRGIVIREPSVIARHKKTKEVLAIGSSAKKMIGRTPASIEAVRPLKDGVIADFDATASMLSFYIKKVHESHGAIPRIPRPRVVIGIPSGVTEVEKRAVAVAAMSSGAREVHLIEEPMAAAIGAGLLVEDPSVNFVIDIGGGTSEIAIISLGGVILGKSLRIAGDEMDEAIINYVRLKYSLLLGQPTAELVKMTIGSAYPETKRQGTPQNEEKYMVVRGRDLETGLPKSIKLAGSEIREALGPIITEIITNVKDLVEEAPPEVVSDILDKGLTMAGGGALLFGIDRAISESANLPVTVAEDPLTCVVRGCGKVLDDSLLLKRIRIISGLK